MKCASAKAVVRTVSRSRVLHNSGRKLYSVIALASRVPGQMSSPDSVSGSEGAASVARRPLDPLHIERDVEDRRRMRERTNRQVVDTG